MFDWLVWLWPELATLSFPSLSDFSWELLWTLLPIFGKGGSTTVVQEKVVPVSPEDTELKKIDLQASQINLEQLERQQAIQNALFFGTPLPEEFGGPDGLDSSLVQQTIESERQAIPRDAELRAAQADYDLQQLQNLQSLGSLPFDVQRLQLESAIDLLPKQADLTSAQLDLAQSQLDFSQFALPLQQRLLEEEVARVERGGLPTPEIEEKINQAIQQSREIGISDIQELSGQRTRDLIASAAGRGLRPTDSPLLSDASLIGKEEARQIGQLNRGLESARLQGLIQQPLQTAQALGPISAQLLGPALGANQPAVGQIPGAAPFGFANDTSSLLQNAQQFAQGFGRASKPFGTAQQAGAAFGSFAPAHTFGPQFTTLRNSTTRQSGQSFFPSLISGAAGLGAAAIGKFSDRRLKTNVKTIHDAQMLLRQLRGTSFEWVSDGHADMGVIAQEVERVLPSLVGHHDGHKTVSYSGLIGLLIEALKETVRDVKRLESKVNAQSPMVMAVGG